MIKPEESLHESTMRQQVRCITHAIRQEESRLRARYAILKYQNGIGLVILLLALTGMLTSGYLYYIGSIPAWACIFASALFASISHEIEHDLIHHQYFRDNPVIYHLMMLVTWLMRPNTVNPWYRRDMHLLHHKVSGSSKDMEERLVGNGIKPGFSRYLVMFDGLAGLILRRAVLRRELDDFSVSRVLGATFPLATLYFACWYIFLLFHGIDLIFAGDYPAWLLAVMRVIDLIVVVLIAPNVVRSGCLNFITSNMHYYGNVNGLMQQTQILDRWYFMPLQLFCFNFGSTHSIHHFVINQPFYLRQMVASKVHKTMQEQGVRRNDLTTFRSANRWVEGACQ
ncbi:fatty acid desaturase [Neptunicella sp. SCSIO 80796]|uniref:fatty acid desaturase n=1 Tax=Neptunicella plasticusilytica TaxID=3117012 RepID=UPI003A4D8599